MKLSNDEIAALKQVLTPLLAWVNYGAGVDAYLGADDSCLLLDPDDHANGVLVKLLERLGK